MQLWELSYKAETAPPPPSPTCPCTSWGLVPICVLQSLFPPLTREPEHPAALGVLGCRISILFIVKYFCCIFFSSSSTLSHLSPVSFLRLLLLVCSSRHDEHFSLLIPSDSAFCCLRSYLSLFLHFSFFSVHSKVSQAMMDSPKLTSSLSRCQERRETEGAALGLSNFF